MNVLILKSDINRIYMSTKLKRKKEAKREREKNYAARNGIQA